MLRRFFHLPLNRFGMSGRRRSVVAVFRRPLVAVFFVGRYGVRSVLCVLRSVPFGRRDEEAVFAGVREPVQPVPGAWADVSRKTNALFYIASDCFWLSRRENQFRWASVPETPQVVLGVAFAFHTPFEIAGPRQTAVPTVGTSADHGVGLFRAGLLGFLENLFLRRQGRSGGGAAAKQEHGGEGGGFQEWGHDVLLCRVLGEIVSLRIAVTRPRGKRQYKSSEYKGGYMIL